MFRLVVAGGVIVAVVKLSVLVLKLHTGFGVKVDGFVALVALKASALGAGVSV